MHIDSKRKEHPHRKRNSQQVIHAGPRKVPPDRTEDGTRKVERRNDIKKVRSHQDDVCCFNGNRRARIEGNTDGGGD